METSPGAPVADHEPHAPETAFDHAPDELPRLALSSFMPSQRPRRPHGGRCRPTPMATSTLRSRPTRPACACRRTPIPGAGTGTGQGRLGTGSRELIRRSCVGRAGRPCSDGDVSYEGDPPAPDTSQPGFTAERPNEVARHTGKASDRKVYLPDDRCDDGMVVAHTADVEAAANTMRTGPPPCVPASVTVHSDRGCHYRWPGWLERMGRPAWSGMSAKGCSPVNAAAEGFFGRMNESVYPEHWEEQHVRGGHRSRRRIHLVRTIRGSNSRWAGKARRIRTSQGLAV